MNVGGRPPRAGWCPTINTAVSGASRPTPGALQAAAVRGLPELLRRAVLVAVHARVEVPEAVEQRAGAGAQLRRERSPHLAPVLLAPDGHRRLDREPQSLQVVGQIPRDQVGLQRRHAAADVDTDGGRREPDARAGAVERELRASDARELEGGVVDSISSSEFSSSRNSSSSR